MLSRAIISKGIPVESICKSDESYEPKNKKLSFFVDPILVRIDGNQKLYLNK